MDAQSRVSYELFWRLCSQRHQSLCHLIIISKPHSLIIFSITEQRRIIRASCEAPQQDIQYTQDTILPAQDDNIYVADSERANRRTCIPLEDMYLNNMARLKPPRSCDLPNVQHLCKNCY
ncbi:Uncharacterized protein Rs2_04387 [Raphanus sativus]|nr:Uncharacterized protein Rs2_04387 [Raphanus sativus]